MVKYPLVSIIIPTYKGNISLKRAIESALNQSYKNIEVIVVDDNDPDTEYRKLTESIMAYFSNNPHVVYIKHDKNKNGSAARNTGFRYSKGDYICFLDDDDVFKESKVEKQVFYLEKYQQYHAAYCWRIQNGEIVKCSKTGDLTKEILTLEYTPYTSSLMLKRDCFKKLDGFDESYKRHQDFEFLLRFFKHYKIGVVEEPLIEIIGNEVNNTLHGVELEELKGKFLNQFETEINELDKSEKGFKKKVYARHYSMVFLNYLKRGHLFSATRVLIKYSLFSGLFFYRAIYKHIINYLKVKSQK